MSVHAGDVSSQGFHHEVLASLLRAEVPFLVGGSFAMARHAGVRRHRADLHLFMRRDDWHGAEAALNRAGIDTHVVFSHWLVRAGEGDRAVDILYNGGNGLTPVDARWFDRPLFEDVAGLRVRLCPPEEMIWSKAFVMDREKFDGADVLHLVRARHEGLDWDRLLELFERYPRVLLAHLVLFGFVYPGGANAVPPWVLSHLWSRLGDERGDEYGLLCRGTLLAREQYLLDVEEWGYGDARMVPFGTMTRQEIAAVDRRD